MSTKAKITLVGAGPGDPDLLTVKGWKALQTADVVLYDALANEELLDLAPKSALRVFVGKRANRHRYPQEEINLMLVQHAFRYGHVVRLKGGDSFVFGAGTRKLPTPPPSGSKRWSCRVSVPASVYPNCNAYPLPAGE